MSGPHTARPSLLAVFAHPDDESIASGGLLARCAAEGIRTSILCLTRGGLGQLDDPARVRMGEERARELDAAARILGVDEVILLDYRNGFLPWVEHAALEHPDHIVVHERTTAAVDAMGLGAPALFYVSMPKGAMRAAWEAATATAEGAGTPEPVPPVVLGVEVDAYGLFTTPPTLRFDASAVAVRKLQALRCHRSQVTGDALDRLTDLAAPRALGVELYRRAAVGASHTTFLDAWGQAPKI